MTTEKPITLSPQLIRSARQLAVDQVANICRQCNQKMDRSRDTPHNRAYNGVRADALERMIKRAEELWGITPDQPLDGPL